MYKHFLSAMAVICMAGSVFGGFNVDPPVITIKANMGENMAWVDLAHTGDGPTAVELTVLERIVDINGEFQTANLPRSGDFTVFPSQVILRPRERARVQVVYNRKQRVTADRTYHLYSREVELPIDRGEVAGVETGINTLMSYYSALNIESGRPGRLTFVSSRAIGDGMIEVIAENRSNGRVHAEGLVITIGGREKIRQFTGKKNSIMPGQQRRFTFRYGRPLSARDVSFGHN